MRVCLLWFIVLFVVPSSNADLQKDLAYMKICNETSPISLDTMNSVLIYKKLDESTENNFKCFLRCLFIQYGWMDEDGGFMVHEMKTILDQAQLEVASIEYILYKCTAVDSVDHCERALLFTKCFWAKAIQKRIAYGDQLVYSLHDNKK